MLTIFVAIINIQYTCNSYAELVGDKAVVNLNNARTLSMLTTIMSTMTQISHFADCFQ